MAKIPGAVTAGTAPQKRLGMGEQLLIGLISQMPGMAMQYFGQIRPEQQERARQLGVLGAKDQAAQGELATQFDLSRQPGVEGATMASFLTGSGLIPQMPSGLADRTGLAGVAKALNPAALATLAKTPGAAAALAEQGRALQESTLRSEAARENVTASQAQRKLAEASEYRAQNTFEFEETLRPGIQRLQDLDISLRDAQIKNEALRAAEIGAALNAHTQDLRRQSYEFVAGLRDRNLQLVADLATQFGGGTAQGVGAMIAQLTPLFGLDADVPALADAYFGAITTGQDPQQLRQFLDLNPVRLVGTIAGILPLDVDQVISHVEAGGDLSDYWNDTLTLITSSFKDKTERDARITQLKTLFEAANSYYKLGEKFNVPGPPNKWYWTFKALVDAAREERGLSPIAQVPGARTPLPHPPQAGR